MKNIFLKLLFLVMVAVGLSSAYSADARQITFDSQEWEQLKGRHFIIFYDSQWGDQQAREMLAEAEGYYKKIGDTVGFTRYADFWTWEQRAKIFIFPDQQSFIEHTGAPAWSIGFADRDSYLFESRAIVTYEQEQAIWKEILPHEISHLVLHDFLPAHCLPIWIDEGVAQLFEEDKFIPVNQLMTRLVLKGQYIKLNYLNNWDIRLEKDPRKVEVFYAQSLSVIKFLRDQYGKERFHRFFRNLRDGKDTEESLSSAYPSDFRSLADLEERWVNFLTTGLE